MPSFSMSLRSSTSHLELVAAGERAAPARPGRSACRCCSAGCRGPGEIDAFGERHALASAASSAGGFPAESEHQRAARISLSFLLALQSVEAVGGFDRHQDRLGNRPRRVVFPTSTSAAKSAASPAPGIRDGPYRAAHAVAEFPCTGCLLLAESDQQHALAATPAGREASRLRRASRRSRCA